MPFAFRGRPAVRPYLRGWSGRFRDYKRAILMYIENGKDGVTLKVRVSPNSSKNVLSVGTGERLEVKLTAPPKEGKANEQLVKFLGKTLGIAPSSISILRGRSSRDKILLVRGLDAGAVKERLP